MLADYLREQSDLLADVPAGDANPWLSDHTLLNLAIWWVKMTRPQTPDFAADVAFVFNSLERDLRQGVARQP